MVATWTSASLELFQNPVHVLPRPHDKLLQEVSPGGELKVDAAPGDLPEGQGRVYGRDVPSIKHSGLSEPLVALGQSYPLALSFRSAKSVTVSLITNHQYVSLTL